MNGSKPFSLSTSDLYAVARGLLYTLAGAAAAYLASYAGTVDQTSTQGLLIVVGVSALVNLLKRFATDTTPKG